jgi:hypothetical protein
MATRDGGAFLAPQLASIAAQTRLPDEVVVGDDLSTDGTPEAIESFSRGFPREVRLERNGKRLGSARNFERTMARCRGEIIVLADQDDVWAPDRLERIEAALLGDPGADFAFSNASLLDDAGRPLPGTLFDLLGFDRDERQRFREGGAMGVLLRHNVVTGATAALRRRALDLVLPFEPHWVHDYFMALVLSAAGRGICLEEKLVGYRRHAGQEVGVAFPTPRGFLGVVRRQDLGYCEEQASAFEALVRRLGALGSPGSGMPPGTIAAVERKARFCRARAEMRRDPFRAPGLAFRGWRDGDYRDCGLGARQLVVDLAAASRVAFSLPGR